MTRGELLKMRQRLASRSAALEPDHPILLWVGGILWAVLLVLFCFI